MTHRSAAPVGASARLLLLLLLLLLGLLLRLAATPQNL